MTDRPMGEGPMPPGGAFDDARLEAALRDLASAIDWPTAAPAGAPDVALRVRVRLADRPARGPRFGWPSRRWRRALLLALAALLAFAAIAGAVGLGLPGLRLVLGEPPVSPPPSVAASATAPAGLPGSTLRLGDLVPLDEVEALTGIAPRLPADPAIGPPDAVYIDRSRADQISFVWAPSEVLPETGDPGVGLILMQFDGRTDDGYHEKLIGQGVTAERVRVDGGAGFWISGNAHFFYYIHADGGLIADDRRWVGDALIWSDGGTTYRIESGLGRDATIALAESLE